MLSKSDDIPLVREAIKGQPAKVREAFERIVKDQAVSEEATDSDSESSLDYAYRMYQDGGLSRAVVTALRKVSASGQRGPATVAQESQPAAETVK